MIIARVLRISPKWAGWLTALGLTVFAFVLRIYDLGRPHSFEFDETYYAKDAWSLLHFGYARNYATTANEQILGGHPMGQWERGPEMIVHPEVGKWLIALGIKAFGMNPTGWRVASVVIGSLMVLLMVRFTLRITGSLILSGTAGLLMCLDGLQFVLSRLALLDIFVAFFLLAALHCMVADRHWGRARLTGNGSWESKLWWRPWRLASGVCWGLALGTKWTPIFALAAFCIVMTLWDIGARRRLGAQRAWLVGIVLDALPAFVTVVVTAFLVYLMTWTGWLINHSVYEQYLSGTQYGPPWGSYTTKPHGGWLSDTVRAFRDLWHYHHDVYQFHTHGLVDAHHVYQSNPQGWLILNRPVGVDAQLNIAPGQGGCTARTGSTCLRQVLLLGTPAVWWSASVAGIAALVIWLGRRDWRYTIPVIGVLSTWLPWMRYDDRPIFSYYAIATEPFLILALVLVLGQIIGSTKSGHRRNVGLMLTAAVIALSAINFAWFWPIYTDGLLTNDQWLQRIWFSRWI